jgi:hypothetical protein
MHINFKLLKKINIGLGRVRTGSDSDRVLESRELFTLKGTEMMQHAFGG